MVNHLHNYKLRWALHRSVWLYTPLIDNALKAGRRDEANDLYGEWISQDELVSDELYASDCSKLLRKARRFHVSTFEYEKDNANWHQGLESRYLKEEVQIEIRKRIAELQIARSTVRWDRFTKLGTFLAALVAAIASVITALHKH